MIITCHHCGKQAEKYTGHVNRALKMGNKLYCDKKCAGLGRRSELSIEEKKRLKSEYDKEYAKRDVKLKKRKRHEYFKRTYDPAQAAIERKKRMPKHVEYCRQPKYKEYKKEYDQQYRAKKEYGEYWESAILVKQIEAQYNNREIIQSNNLHNKSQKRKRQWKTKSNYLPRT